MRKILMLAILSLCILNCHATVFNVTVSDFQFSPANIPNVMVGDVITFTWSNGFHTTTCDPGLDPETSLPYGAAKWNYPMNAGSNSYSYTVTTPGNYNYVCLYHSPNMGGSFTVSSPLPVILTSFKVSNVNNKAVINWKTSSEINSNYFSVKKSTNGKTFTEIGKVDAAGNSTSERSYSFIDNDPVNNDQSFIYYLAEIIDKDGRSNFSPIEIFKSTIGTKKMILSLTPNPVTIGSHLMVNFNATKDDKMLLDLMDIQGKTVAQSIMDAHKGINMGHMHIGNLPAGTYTARFTMNNITESYVVLVKP